MPNKGETEVLVVGAGPVGLLTALLLTQQGLPTRIIDQAGIKDILWVARVQYELELVQCYGKGHCWLAGDAAHQSSPAVACKARTVA